jgi:hypothetical protein
MNDDRAVSDLKKFTAKWGRRQKSSENHINLLRDIIVA